MNGADGDNGVDGATGPTGPTGADGINGENGMNGANGAPGQSAYLIALGNGFSGSEADWLDSLEGAPGADGTFATAQDVATQLTADYTLAGTEAGKILRCSSSDAEVITIPADATYNFPAGTRIDLLQTGVGQFSVEATSPATVNATPGLKLRTQWSSATMIKIAANSWVVVGDLTA
jgi:hypothetical protein